MRIMVRHGPEHAAPARVHHRSMRGTRRQKYEAASAATLADDAWATLSPEAPFWSFAPGSADDRYDSWPMITDVFPASNSGVKTERDNTVSDTDRARLTTRIRTLLDRGLTADEIVERLGIRQKSNWTVATRRDSFGAWEEQRMTTWSYRSFDCRHLYWDPGMMARPESIRLGPGLDSALEAILSSTLELVPTIDPPSPFG